MIRILIICLLIALCNTYELDRSALKKLKNDISVAKNFFNNEVDSNEAIVFFGNAKSGKSTLVNYLIPNNELSAKLMGIEGSMKILKTSTNPTGPKISDGPVSETKIPTKWSSQIFPTFSLWDTPGFQDTRGPTQDIVNCIYIKQLMMNVKNPRIVLVVDWEVTDEYFKSFRSLLKSVKALFNDNFKKIFSSIAVIFTKVNHEYGFNYITQLKEMLKDKLEMEKDEDIKKFLRDLITTNNNRIGLFKVPEHEGTFGKECNININDAINNCQGISNDILQNVSLSLSPESSVDMYQTLNRVLLNPYFSYMRNLGDEFKSEIQTLKNSLDIAQHDEKIKPELMRQLALLVCAKEEQEFKKKFDYLKNFSAPMKQKIENYELQTDYNLIIFIDDLLKSHGGNEVSVINQVIKIRVDTALDLQIMKDRLAKSTAALNELKIKIGEEMLKNEEKIKEKQQEYINILEKKRSDSSLKNRLLSLAAVLLGAFALVFFVIL